MKNFEKWDAKCIISLLGNSSGRSRRVVISEYVTQFRVYSRRVKIRVIVTIIDILADVHRHGDVRTERSAQIGL